MHLSLPPVRQEVCEDRKEFSARGQSVALVISQDVLIWAGDRRKAGGGALVVHEGVANLEVGQRTQTQTSESSQ